MTDFSRIEMAFEVYKNMISDAEYWDFKFKDLNDYENKCKKCAKKSFILVDIFIEEAKKEK
jgi:hypothetical protein